MFGSNQTENISPIGELSQTGSARSKAWAFAIVAAASLSFLCKLLLAVKTYGTNDVYAYYGFANWAGYLGVDLYRASQEFNHPPFALYFLRSLAWLAQVTGLGFPFWLRLPGIVADLGNLWLVWRILGSSLNSRSIRWGLLWLASSPVLLLVCGFHGNTDSVMIFFLLLSIYFLEREKLWAGGAALGMAMNIKVVPLIAIPVFFFYLRGYRRRLVFFATAAAMWLMSGFPFVFQDPQAIYQKVFGYRSGFGHWGLSFLTTRLAAGWPEAAAINAAFEKYGAYAVLAAIVLIAFWMSRLDPKPGLFSQVGLVFLFFLSCSTGFGVQYLAWLAPFALLAGPVAAAFFGCASGTFLFLVYDYWAHGMPWYLADSNQTGDYPGHVGLFHLLSWLSVVLLLGGAWRRMRPVPATYVTRFRIPSRAGRMATGAFAAASLVYGTVVASQHHQQGTAIRAKARDRVAAIHAWSYSYLAEWLYKQDRNRLVMAVAKQAIAEDKSNFEAFQTLGVVCADYGMLDESIQAFQNAVRLRPDSALAKGNLLLVMERKRRTHRQ